MKSRFWNRRPPVSGRRMILEALEERIVMDAAIDPIPQSHSLHHTDSGFPPYDPTSFFGIGNSLTMRQLTAGVDSHHTTPLGHASDVAGSVAAASNGNLDVVLVSDALEGKNEIVAAATPNTKVIVYSAAHDNLDSINAKLGELVSSAGKKISHLAVASHGTDGILQVGSDKLDFSSALAHRSGFQNMAKNLEPHAQIQLYSCSLAADQQGKDLVSSIAVMTGADVYASTDVTGAKPHNWTLEYASYTKAPMASLFNADKLEKVPGELAQVVATTLTPSEPHIDSFNDHVPGSPRMPVTLANEVVFSANNGAGGQEVFKSPVIPSVATGAVAAGQTALTNFPGLNPNIQGITRLDNGFVYYSAFNNNLTGNELMRSDPSAAPAVTAISNFGAGVNDYNPHISQITAQTNNTLFFVAQQAGQPAANDQNGFEVWLSNGGPVFPNVVTRFGPANLDDGSNPNIRELVPARDNTSTYFAATSPITQGSVDGGITQGTEVWRTTGTAPVAPNITDVGTGAGTELGAVSRFGDLLGLSGFNPDVSQLTPAVSAASNATLYFVGNEPSAAVGYEVWRTDGANPGAGQVTANANGGLGNVTNFGLGTATNPGIHDLTFVPASGTAANRIYMVADNNDGIGAQIWRSDGGLPGATVTDRGNAPVTPLFGVNANISQLTQFGGSLYFVGNNSNLVAPENYEVFRLTPGAGAGGPDVLTAVTAFPDTLVPAAPRMDIFPDVPSCDPIRAQFPAHTNAHINLIAFTAADNTLWFEADSQDNRSRELFSVSAVGADQVPVQRTNFNFADPNFAFLTDAGGSPVFAAQNPANGQELFTIGNTRPQALVNATTVLEDNNNHNNNVPLHNAVRISDPDLGDTLTVRVEAVNGFQSQTGDPVGLRMLEFTQPLGNPITPTPLAADGSLWRITAPASWVAQGDINAVLATMTAHLKQDTNANTVTSAATAHRIDITVTDNGTGLLQKVGHLTDIAVPAGADPNVDPGQAPNFTVTPVNDQPVFNPSTITSNEFPGIMWGGIDRSPAPAPGRFTPPIPQVVAAGSNLVFNDANLNRIGVGDVDVNETLAPNNLVHVQALAGAGIIRLATPFGPTFAFDAGSANDRASIGFQGNLTDINAALNGMRFRPAAYFEGSTNITFILDDTNPYLPAAFAPPTLPLGAGVGGHTGQPESGQISTVTAVTPGQPFTGTVPRTEPVVGTIPITVGAPVGNFFGKLVDLP